MIACFKSIDGTGTWLRLTSSHARIFGESKIWPSFIISSTSDWDIR